MRLLPGIAALALAGCAAGFPEAPTLRGETMGSAWSVQLGRGLPAASVPVLQAGVQAQFDAVNQATGAKETDSQ